jgi:hypothetical protein
MIGALSPTSSGVIRVAFDTNVWSLVAENGEAQAVSAGVTARGWRVVLPPAALLEAARTRDRDMRSRLLKAMLDARHERLGTEAMGETQEFVTQSRLFRPEWVRRREDRTLARRWEAFWTRRIWQKARYNPEWLAEFAWRQAESSGAAPAVAAQRFNREQLIDGDIRLSRDDLWAVIPDDETAAGMSAGDRVEKWREQNARVFWTQLRLPANYGQGSTATTYSDWIAPHLDLAQVRSDPASFNRFWYRDVSADQMPRNWIRSTVETLQWKYRVRESNPFDEQQAAYLVDCDVYVTADRVFALVLQELARNAPVALAQVVQVPRVARSALSAIVDAVMDGLSPKSVSRK